MAKTIKMGIPYRHEDEDYDDEKDDESNEEEINEEESESTEQSEQESSKQKTETKSIMVKVKRIENDSSDELSMKIDRDIELRWLMVHYCNKVGIVNMSHCRTKFMFDGVHVRETDTPFRLSMLDGDIIYAFPYSVNPDRDQFLGESSYRTLSIRMHKRRDTFLRVTYTEPLLPQLKRHLFREDADKRISTCFFFDGRMLTEDFHVAGSDLYDGDIIDAFDFEESKVEKQESSETKAISNSIIVKVKRIRGGENEELSVQIDRDVELRWLMLHYWDKVGNGGMNKFNTKFMYNGIRVRKTDTPLRLSMVDNDIIHVLPEPPRSRSRGFYRTLSIRMHKRRDTSHTTARVTCTEPLVPQLKQHLLRENAENCISTSFFYNGRKLTEDHCVSGLKIEDGDIIDGFDFEQSSSSVKIITPISRRMTLSLRYGNGTGDYSKTKGYAPLRKLVHMFAELWRLNPEKIVLHYCGRQLQLHKTAEEENLFDGCLIDVSIRDSESRR